MKDSQKEQREEPVENKTARNRCAVCNQVVEGEVVFAAKRFWCRYHFTCSRCNITLRGDKYNIVENKHYCMECFEIVRPRCIKCRQNVQLKEEFVKFGSNKVSHKTCFLCEDCKKPLNVQAFVVDNNTIFCEPCSLKRRSGTKA
uniref:LIM zinc-binding domain-containing protein n=1 Tax=Romanomermis culicivorax TaxID=13658 RepID=A0A915KNP8_ROMCU